MHPLIQRADRRSGRIRLMGSKSWSAQGARRLISSVPGFLHRDVCPYPVRSRSPSIPQKPVWPRCKPEGCPRCAAGRRRLLRVSGRNPRRDGQGQKRGGGLGVLGHLGHFAHFSLRFVPHSLTWLAFLRSIRSSSSLCKSSCTRSCRAPTEPPMHSTARGRWPAISP